MRARLPDKELQRLARYWFRAELMREHVHVLVEEYEPNLSGLNKSNWWEFETYLMHWLGALFVLVEAFNKLKIQDTNIRKLFNAHLPLLKAARHETYHFTLETAPFDETIFKHDRMNWAEELHDALGDYIRELVMLRANVEQFMKKRKKDTSEK